MYSAQMQVYNLYKNRLYNSSFRILKNREDAQDAVQESFIKGFEKIHQIKEEKHLGSWLNRIVINYSLDVLRKRKKIVWLEETYLLETEIEEVVNEDDITFSVDKIKACIHQLKEKYRIVLVLYLIENYTHKEIGHLLKINESTVRNQYRRGKNMLLEQLNKNH